MRWLASWTLYWLGDAVSRFDFFWGRWEWSANIFYPIYNRLMLAAVEVQGDGPGPWLAKGDGGTTV